MGIIFVSLFVSSPLPPSTSPLFITPYHRSTSATFQMETILRPLVNTPMPTLPARSKRQGQLMCPHTKTLYSPPPPPPPAAFFSILHVPLYGVWGDRAINLPIRGLLETLVSLQPQRSVTQGESKEEKVLTALVGSVLQLTIIPRPTPMHPSPPLSSLPPLSPPSLLPPSPPPSLVLLSQVLNLSADVLRHVPEPIDYEATAKLVSDEMNPLNVVLLQEVSAYSIS